MTGNAGVYVDRSQAAGASAGEGARAAELVPRYVRRAEAEVPAAALVATLAVVPGTYRVSATKRVDDEQVRAHRQRGVEQGGAVVIVASSAGRDCPVAFRA